MREVKQLKHYLDERIILWQLIIFSVYLVVDTCYNVLEDWLLIKDPHVVPTCNLYIADLTLQTLDLLIKMIVLAIILTMAIRQSQIIIDQGDDKVQKQLFAHVDINNTSHRELDKIEDRRQS